MGPVATALGSLAALQGHYEDAERRFRSAVELCERLDLRSFLAMTRLHWARMLVERDAPGDRTRVVTLARQALAPAEQIGMNGVAREGQQLLTKLEP